MQVDIIDSFERLAPLKSNWDDVFARDPESHFFLSWRWIYRRLGGAPDRWFVLAVRESGQCDNYVAFFPLKLSTQLQKNCRFRTVIDMAGKPVSDYTGFLCLPAFEARAIPALGEYLRQRHWAALNMVCFRASKKRSRLFLRCFADRDLVVRERDNFDDEAGLDNDVAPYAALSGDWEAYLTTCLSANTRQKIRRFLKKVDGSGDYRISHADETTIERSIDILLGFWLAQWAETHGEIAPRLANTYRDVLSTCFADGTLTLPVIWRDERPLAAIGLLADVENKALLFYVGGRDKSFRDLPVGFVLHAHAIRYAIAEGYSSYEFLRGGESYKYSFATGEHRTKHIDVMTRTGQNLGGGLDRLGVRDALRIANRLRSDGHAGPAAIAYRQILEVDPQCGEAIRAYQTLRTAPARPQPIGPPPAILSATGVRSHRS